MKKVVLIFLVIISFSYGSNNSILHSYERMTLQGTYHWSIAHKNNLSPMNENLQTLSSFLELPILKDTKFYTALDIELFHISLSLPESNFLSKRTLQRYGIFMAYPLFQNKKNKHAVMVSTGVASDFYSIKKSFYIHGIYDYHRYISDNLHIGIGIAVSYELGSMRKIVNLLPSLQWFITPNLRLQSKWDNLHLTWLIKNKLSLATGIQYDMSFFTIQETYRYDATIITGELSMGYTFAKKWLGKITVSSLLFGKDTILKNDLILKDIHRKRTHGITVSVTNFW